MLQGGLQKGAQLPQLAGVDFSKSQKILLVAMDANCDSCRESLPFFNSLVEKLRGKPGDARLITVFQDGEEQTRRYAEQSRLNVDTVFGVDFKLLGLSALPSIILIDSTGTVLDFWIGKPSKDTEEQILKHLTVGA
jgi:peroxiredoxin